MGSLAEVRTIRAEPARERRDELTGIPTRSCLVERLTEALEGGEQTAVLFCDLDDFKFINDGLGHATGDRLLIEVAARLSAAVRPQDLVARMGGDEFAVVCHAIPDETAALVLAERLRSALAEPIELGGRRRQIRASVGCRVASGGAGSADEQAAELLRDADVAMYQAKSAGKDRVEVFSAATRAGIVRRVELEHELTVALDEGSLVLHYQPHVDLVTGRLLGVEALARWPHPRLGAISPGEFVPVAEATGLIAPLGAWVFRETCMQVSRWRREDGLADLTASVNVSVQQLADPGFPEHVTRALEESGVPPSSICVELTESALMGAGEGPLAALRALKELGLYVAVDDFGTGYSSLAALKRLPVEVLKVDRSFVDGLGTDPDDSAIVTTIMSLAHAMGLHVVAEGVETPLQASELVTLGCRVAQGFLYSPAVAPDEIPRLVARPARRWATSRRPLRAKGSFIEEMLDQIGVPERAP